MFHRYQYLKLCGLKSLIEIILANLFLFNLKVHPILTATIRHNTFFLKETLKSDFILLWYKLLKEHDLKISKGTTLAILNFSALKVHHIAIITVWYNLPFPCLKKF